MGFTMSFFFQTVETKRPSRQQRNAETLQRIGCNACPLNKAKVHTPKMQPTLADETLIYFIGESPGNDEDKNSGQPFTGPSGQLLRHCIPDDLLEFCSFDNVINCHPEGNRNPEWAEIEACRPRRVKFIEQAKPKLIVGLGAFAQQYMLGSSDQQGLRGRVFAVKVGSHSCWFLPTYHPARVLHSASEQAKNQGKKKLTNNELLRTYFGRTFKLDLEKAFKLVETLEPPVIPTEAEIRSKVTTFERNEDFDQLLALLTKVKKAPYKAVDIETTHLRPYAKNAKILSCAFSFNSTNFAFAIDHPKAQWTSQQRKKILEELKSILIDDTIKVAHNSVFEVEWFVYYFGKEVINHCAWECSQLQAHFLDERRGAGQSDDDNKRATYLALNFLAKMYFGIPFKEWFQVDRKNMGQADLAETLVYNAADTLITLKLWHRQTQQLRTQGLYNAYLTALPRQPVLALTQYLGIPVNQIKVKELQGKLSDQIAVLEAEIESVDVVKQYIKDKPVKYKDKEPFNPMGNDAIVLFRDYLKRSEIQIQDGKAVRWSVDRRILEKIDHPLAKLIVALRNKIKMKSTYVDSIELGKGRFIYPDGKIHCNFNSTFTTTGRLSSDELNMQNYPKRNDNWVRAQIEAPSDCIMVAIDYGQLEMCGAAICSKDKVLIKNLWEDYDTHFFWASRLASICPQRVGGDFNDPKIAKSFRSTVKNSFVFPAIYGATNKSIAQYFGIDQSFIDELSEEFWDTFNGIKRWQETLLKNYRVNGYVEAPTGRRRHHPLTTNEAINAPIQSVSSDIVMDGMCRLSYIAATEDKWYLHPHINVHDDLSYFIPKKKADEALERIIKEMLTPSFDFINVPLSVEVSIGANWADLEHLGKYWSHK